MAANRKENLEFMRLEKLSTWQKPHALSNQVQTSCFRLDICPNNQ